MSFCLKKSISQINFKFVNAFVFLIGRKIGILNIPELVIYLCLKFFNTDKDEWDVVNVDLSILINDSNVKRITHGGFRNAFLKNVAKNGKHVWIFNIMQCGYWDCIGIAPFRAVMSTDEDLGCFQCHGATYYQRLCSTHHNGTGIVAYDGDIIEMSLNFKTLILSFKRNYQLVYARKIMKTEYLAGVTLSEANAEIKLISYIHSVSC